MSEKTVILHVGPHKTGTTSIQYFFRYFVSVRASDAEDGEGGRKIRYPDSPLSAHGDVGHNHLAELFSRGLGLYDPARGQSYIRQEIYNKRQDELLLISAENFSFLSKNELIPIKKELKEYNIHLLFTLAPLSKRYVSLYSTWVQFGGAKDMEAAGEEILSNPSMHPQIFRKFYEALEPSASDLIMSAPGDGPDVLLRTFMRVVGASWPDGADDMTLSPKHVSLGRPEVELLLKLNQLLEARNALGPYCSEGEDWRAYAELRRAVIDVFGTASWKRFFGRERLPLPDSARATLRNLCNATLSELEELRRAHGLRIHGDVSALADGL